VEDDIINFGRVDDDDVEDNKNTQEDNTLSAPEAKKEEKHQIQP